MPAVLLVDDGGDAVEDDSAQQLSLGLLTEDVIRLRLRFGLIEGISDIYLLLIGSALEANQVNLCNSS